MSAGCNFFLTVKEVFNTHALDRTKFVLQNGLLDDQDSLSTHSCNLCEKALTVEEINILHEMRTSDTVKNLDHDETQALCYVAGYVARKHSRDLSADHTKVSPAVKQYLEYFECLNRGGLVCPSEEFLYFMLLVHYFFSKSDPMNMYRNRLEKIFSDFAGVFHLDITVPVSALRCSVNILMKRFSLKYWPSASRDRQMRTIQKLSS